MMSRRVISILVFASAFAGHLPAQIAATQAQPASPQSSSEPHTIAMTVPDGTPLQIALDKEVRVRKFGEPITGRVMQPVYVFDHLVIPVGTVATGRISAIEPVPGSTRTLDALNADFTPPTSSPSPSTNSSCPTAVILTCMQSWFPAQDRSSDS